MIIEKWPFLAYERSKFGSKRGRYFALNVFCGIITAASELQDERILMHAIAATLGLKQDHRVQAVLAFFRGEPSPRVCTQFSISRSDLYKFRAGPLSHSDRPSMILVEGPSTPPTALTQTESRRSLCRNANESTKGSPTLRHLRRKLIVTGLMASLPSLERV